MVDFTPIKDIIDRALALDVGNPNGAVSEQERLLRENAISLGTLDYYRTFPMRLTMSTTYNANNTTTTFDWAGIPPLRKENGVVYITFDDFFLYATPKIPEEMKKYAYFLGILRMERPYWSSWSNPGAWERQMFGYQVSGTQNFDIMKTILNNTYDDLSTGQPRYMINRMQNRIDILQPWGFGQLSLEGAIGFTSPEFVEMSRVDNLCKFISLRFVESIIQARDGVVFDADFQINTDALQRRLETLKEEVDSIKNDSVLHVNIWS